MRRTRKRKDDIEFGEIIELRSAFDTTTETVDDAPTERQTDPYPRTVGFAQPERIENAQQFVTGNAGSGVTESQTVFGPSGFRSSRARRQWRVDIIFS
jgi:hypothetical protein